MMRKLVTNVIQNFVLKYDSLKSYNLRIIELVLTGKKLKMLLCQIYNVPKDIKILIKPFKSIHYSGVVDMMVPLPLLQWSF